MSGHCRVVAYAGEIQGGRHCPHNKQGNTPPPPPYLTWKKNPFQGPHLIQQMQRNNYHKAHNLNQQSPSHVAQIQAMG